MSLHAPRALLRTRPTLRQNYICPQCRLSSSTTTPGATPLLLKLKGDLKSAMKAKDTNRLNVLRSLLAEITNSSKTKTPISTDTQLLSLLRKRSAAAKSASDEFKAAGREDLVEKEEAQAAVLEEYAGSVETMSEGEIQEAVVRVVEEVKAVVEGKVNMGDVLKKILGPGGSLEGKPVDRSSVARIVKQVLGS